MNKYLVFLIPFLFFNKVYSQVLFNETFDNYALGDFYNGTGNWSLIGSIPKIVQESNRGNVLSTTINKEGNLAIWQYVSQIWGNRTAGNNILLMKYDVYYEDFLNNSNVEQHNSNLDLFGATSGFLSKVLFTRGFYGGSPLAKSNIDVDFFNIGQKKYSNVNFTKSWFTVKLYIDYNTNKMYVHIPALNIVGEHIPVSTISVLDRILFQSRVIDSYQYHRLYRCNS